MKWTKPFRKDFKTFIDSEHLIDQIIARDETLLEAQGAPMTCWFRYRNDDPRAGARCFCYPREKASPDSRHKLCFGNGYLNGYQKYGYVTKTWASSDTTLTLNNVVVQSSGTSPGLLNDILSLKSGTTGTITTPFVPLTNFISHSFFESVQNTVTGVSSVSYQYSFDGMVWNSTSTGLVVPSTGQIQFRATLSRININVKLPYVNYFRYRFQNLPTLASVDSRFPLATIPAFFGSRSMAVREIAQVGAGFQTVWPTRYWSIVPPIEEGTIGMFLYGNFAGLRYEAINLKLSTMGDLQTILHREWETRFIRDYEDVSGILYMLY